MDDIQATYLSRRLAETRRVQSLAASIRFDLARSGLDDDQLETAVNAFSQQESPSTGWGWSTVLDDLMTREPKRVPVTDMKSYQQNLINLGYASPLTVATGTWDPSWYGASRRFDRDGQEGQMAGKTMLAAPLRQGIELLGQTMPSSIWKNVVGWAKGFVEQTPETVGRVGALGGLVSGAALGGLVGGPVGAGIGGAIGAGIAFFGDLLSDAPGEEDQSVLASVVDALTPFEEYAGNSKAFFEDLGYVGTIASVIGGVKVGTGLVKGSIEGISSTLANQGAADIQLGLPGSVARWMTGKIAPDSLEAVSNAIARVSPIAHLAKYPAAGMVNGIYTGFSTASVGIHLTAGLGQGARDVNEDIRTQAAALVRASVTEGRNLSAEEMDLIDKANHGVGVSTIEKAIASTEAPGKLGSLNMGPQVLGMPLSDWLLPANMLDIASFFFWPQKLFPIVPGGISKTIGKLEDVPLGSVRGLARSWARLDGSEHMLRPWVLALTGDGISSSEARAWAKEHINPAYNAYVRMDAGVKTMTARTLREKTIEMSTADLRYGEEYRALISKMYAEGETGLSPTALRAFGETVSNDNSLLAHLIDTKPAGKDLRTAILQHQEAIGELSRLEGSMRAAGFTNEFMAGPSTASAAELTPELTRMASLTDRQFLEQMRAQNRIVRDDALPFKDLAFEDAARLHGIDTGGLNMEEFRKWFPIAEETQLGSGISRQTEVRSADYGNAITYVHRTEGKVDAFLYIPHNADGSVDLNALLIRATGSGGGTDKLIEAAIKDLYISPAEILKADIPLTQKGALFLRRQLKQMAAKPGGGVTSVSRVQVSRLPEGKVTIPYGRMTIQHDASELESLATRLEAQLAQAEAAKFAPGATLKDLPEMTAKIDKLKADIAATRKLLDEGGKENVARGWEKYRLMMNRLDTPTRREWYEMKRQQYALRQKLDALTAQAKKAKAGIETPGFGSPQYMKLHQKLSDLVDGWLGKGLIDESIRDSALAIKTNKRLGNFLDARAKDAAIDADVPEATRAYLLERGYKPVLTGENVISPTEAERWIEVSGIGDYTRRRAFFEMIGLREKPDLDNSLWKLRQATEMSELQQSAEKLGIERTPKDIYLKIYKHMEELNHPGTPGKNAAVWGPFLFTGSGPKLFKIDIRQMRPQDIIEALEGVLPKGREWEAGMEIYGALRRGVAFGGDWKGLGSMSTMRALGRSLSISGLSGFSDLIRTFNFEDPLAWGTKGVSKNLMSKAKFAGVGAGVGAVVGLTAGDQPSDILAGAGIGAAVSLGGRGFAGRAYGYLPDSLVRINTALRYTLSLTFDAGRYSEQNMIAMAKYGLSPMFSPKRNIKGRGEMKTPYRNGTVSGEEAWSDAVRFWDEVNGTSWFQSLDDTDRRMYQAGLLGFQPRNWEAAQAFQLYQRGWSRPKIEEAIKNIGRYGLGRSAAEKSANFIFFPFSFSKKLLSTLGDFAIQAPGRNLLIYEGMRRYYESTLDEDFHALIADHLPLLEQLSKVNNLTYGLSPGRFFFKGLGDQRTNAGKAAMILSQFFVPSGAATPLAQSAGSAADLAVNMFVPIIFTGESIDRLGGVDGVDDIISRYIPLSREITQYFRALNEQKTAITQGETPWAQVQDYLDSKREFTDGLRPMASLMGFVSPEAFLQSNAGLMWKRQWDDLNLQLAQDYPSAQATLGNFETRTTQSAQVLYELAQKQERGAGEDAILSLAMTVETYERMKGLGYLPPSVADRVESAAVRALALAHADDRRFRELYVLLFAREFGPLEVST